MLHVHKSEVGLVDESRRLKAVTGTFAGDTASGNPAKLLMDQRH